MTQFSLRLKSIAVQDYTGTAVFRLGLKNGNGTTVAVVFLRWASIVNSI